MNGTVRTVYRKQIERAVEALQKNRMTAEYIETPGQLLDTLANRIPAGSSCSLGGSETVTETGVKGWLEGRSDITYLDRYAENADVEKILRDALTCDYYITGTNALTLKGELYNIDGRGNRVAAMCYGPRQVIVITGFNKIVPDIEAAKIRMKNLAAPANATRLQKKTPCVSTGICQDCASPDRICSQELVSGWQMIAGRIHVCILGEQYGY